MKFIKNLAVFIPAIICMVIIFLFSSQNNQESTAVSNAAVEAIMGSESVGKLIPTVIIRKAAHFLEYAALSALLFLGLSYVIKNKKKITIFLSATGISALFAATDELHQYFIPGRAGMIEDVILDTAGAAAGAAAAWLIVRIIERHRRNKNK